MRKNDILKKLRGLKFKAIIFGFLVDTIGTLAIAAVLVNTLAAKGLPEAEITTRMHGPSGLLLMLILGLGFTLLGGYVAGRTARQAEILHGATVAGIGLVLGLFLRDTGLPLWYETVSLLAMIPAGIASVILREMATRKGM